MDRKAIVIFTFLLAAIMLLSACGGTVSVQTAGPGSASAPVQSEQQAAAADAPTAQAEVLPEAGSPATGEAEAPEADDLGDLPVAQIPEALAGVWISVADPEDRIVIDANGTGKVDEALPEEGKVAFRFYVAESEADGWLLAEALDQVPYTEMYGTDFEFRLLGDVLMFPEGMYDGYFYREGDKDPVEYLYGTWTLSTGDISPLWNGAKAEQFVVGPGMLTINGDALPIRFAPNDLSDGSDQPWMFYSENGLIQGLMFQPEVFALSIQGQNLSGKYYKDVKSVELTPDNWQDFFEWRIVYTLERDKNTGKNSVKTWLCLMTREDVKVLGTRNASAYLAGTEISFSMIKYNIKTHEYSFEKPEPAYLRDINVSRYISGVTKNLRDGKRIDTVDSRWVEMEGSEKGGFFGMLYGCLSRDASIQDDIATALVLSKVSIKATKMSGTIYYQ